MYICAFVGSVEFSDGDGNFAKVYGAKVRNDKDSIT